MRHVKLGEEKARYGKGGWLEKMLFAAMKTLESKKRES
jgi:hypothetical protein